MPDSHATMAEEIARLRPLNAELLAALREIADIIQGGDKLERCEPWAQELIRRARAAIAKAEETH